MVVYIKIAPQRYSRVKVPTLLVGVSSTSTTVYAIKKRMDDGEGVNRRAGIGRKAVMERESLRDAIRGTAC